MSYAFGGAGRKRVASIVGICAIVGMTNAVSAQQARVSAADDGTITIETDTVRFACAADGENVAFIDKRTGANFCRRDPASKLAHAEIGSEKHEVTSLALDGDRLILRFAGIDTSVALKAYTHARYFELEVVSREGTAVDRLTFIDMPLTLEGTDDEDFAACALALNLKTNVHEIPAANALLRAICYDRFGVDGARVAIIGCPKDALRDVMKEVVANAPDLPKTNIGGPWALDAEINHGSYLMDIRASVTEETVDDWIELMQNLGITQLDFHAGVSLRFGDYEPNPKLYPRGRASLKAVIDKLHAAGMLAGLHTYAEFIAKDTPWVTPVPSPHLLKKATLTLAADIDGDATTIPVEESTADISPITGFFVRNSAVIQIEDELIVFNKTAKEAPFRFSECERGAHGTTKAAHPKGAKVHHLQQVFNLFAPEADSPLFTEVAARTADVYNECGFDMIYLDALDGSDVYGGWPDAWHYASRFTFELARRLDKPALFEMSTFGHHLWYVRSRMGAWDVPARGAKPFVDMHTIVNEGCERIFLPSHLGWWGAFPFNNVQPERTFPDDMEYLCAKCIGYGSSLSLLTGFSVEEYKQYYNTRRLGAIVKQYETLRRNDYFPESVKKQLRARGKEFTLEQADNDEWQFRPIEYAQHKVRGLDGRSAGWTVENRFGRQPARLRVELLIGAESFHDPASTVFFDPARTELLEPSLADSRKGVTSRFEAVAGGVDGRPGTARFTATNTRKQAKGSWSSVGRLFEPDANLAGKGLGVWIHGDGKGELLNFQLKCPKHHHNGQHDNYVTVDFEGWRYFEFIEPESDRIPRHEWPYFGHREDWERAPHLMVYAYPVLHFWMQYDHISYVRVWYNDIPPGETVECHIGPIKAVPLKRITIRNPSVTIDGRRIMFPTELETGSYVEFISRDDCKIYDARGELVGQVVPEGDVPTIEPGENHVSFACEPPPGANVRANVTVITRGDPID